jgi:hypothetical protein
MDIRKKYTEETGKLYYKEATLEFEWDDDYVEWLEQNLVKLFAIPAVIKSVCENCSNTDFNETMGCRNYLQGFKCENFKQTGL